MKQAVSSQRVGNKNYERVPFRIIKAATSGDIEALTLIQRHYDPYIKRIATIRVRGTSYLNIDLYDRLKTRLIVETLQLQQRGNVGFDVRL